MAWKREPLEETELDELLTAAERHSLRHEMTCRTLAYTGLRANEFAHMTEEWVDWQNEQIRVPPEQSGWTPKTAHAVRTIPVREPAALRTLRDYFKRHEKIGVSRQAITKRVKAVAADTELRKKVTPHVLRHTYGTLIAARGATPQYIRQTMGHADLSSANAYIQFTGSQLNEEANVIWKV
ncbi:tyrosine-type recombinase/integrase [Halomarina oriensis]|uniref:Tyrosine-type recombinase/integrase n=1 Tax=Halomarina oriensis TaxID=671145 RepID=A0A6B0GGZ8_9EURY|nr:site-specific integrase [Halomarina oriensis]MWG34152.1 tyrosine-type recombinase/integrase [Halomarina oriensis]